MDFLDDDTIHQQIHLVQQTIRLHGAWKMRCYTDYALYHRYILNLGITLNTRDLCPVKRFCILYFLCVSFVSLSLCVCCRILDATLPGG